MKQYFSFVEHGKDQWFLTPKYSLFGEPLITGSYAVLPARFFGLSWEDWLHYCENNGAQLYGKNSKYVCAVWKEPNNVFLKEVNKRVSDIANIINIKELNY